MNTEDKARALAQVGFDSFVKRTLSTSDGRLSIDRAFEEYQRGNTVVLETHIKLSAAREAACDCGARAAKTTHANWCSYHKR